VLKENAVSDIIGCLRSVASGQYFISPAISHLLVRRTERSRGLASQTSGLSSLTPSERRILNLIARGKTSKEIAAELFISPKTVENHRQNIAGKLEIHGNNALLKFALENKDNL
jgi:DNA-binding NarL/FixJ family response regulator